MLATKPPPAPATVWCPRARKNEHARHRVAVSDQGRIHQSCCELSILSVFLAFSIPAPNRGGSVEEESRPGWNVVLEGCTEEGERWNLLVRLQQIHRSISDFGRDRLSSSNQPTNPPTPVQTHPPTTLSLNPQPLQYSRNPRYHKILQNPSWTQSDHTCHRRDSREKALKRLRFQVHEQRPLALLTAFNPGQRED